MLAQVHGVDWERLARPGARFCANWRLNLRWRRLEPNEMFPTMIDH